MQEQTQAEAKPTAKLRVTRHFGWLCVVSLLLAPVPYAIFLTMRWTDHWQGFVGGLVMSPVWALAWSLTVFPYCLVVRFLYRVFGWRRHFARIVLGPSVALFGVGMYPIVAHPPTAESEFRLFARTALPKDAGGVRYRFCGGNVIAYRMTFYFRTSGAEVEGLVSDMGLAPWQPSGEADLFSPLPACPDYRSWEGAEVYRNDDGHFERILVVDSERTQVYVAIFECN